MAELFKVGSFAKRDDPFASWEHFFDESLRACDGNLRAGAHFASGTGKTFPAVVPERFEEKNFLAAVVGEEAGFNDPGVVQCHQVAFAQH